jgi:hypothetical protein
VKQTPILFNDEMVREILAGHKTMTRRAIKPQPVQPSDGSYFDAYNGGPQWNWWASDNRQHLEQIINCPYGKTGDLLSVEGVNGSLEITGVRVERLQDISEDDSMAEGIPFEGDQPSPRDNFSALWESIIGSGSWNANPWVWVIEFKRVDSGVSA